jgi:transcriptional regulator with XRE-family HTH domain
MSDNKQSNPYKTLGTALKRTRQKLQESLAEVSGAVEIEVDVLSAIELGAQRPSEDILLLLISHFGIKEDEASKLWELANYDQAQLPFSNDSLENEETKSSVMVVPMDSRINYTDMVHIMVNNYGVVMNFMQGAGPNNQPLAVARVGMSREHAKSVLELLQRTLEQSEQKTLPRSTKEQKRDNKSSQQ